MLAGADLGQNIFQRVVQVDAQHFVAGHHDVVHRHVFKIQNRQQHGAVAVRDQGARFMYHGAQLITGQAIAAVIHAFHANQSQQPVRHHIDQPHQGVKQL